MHTLLLSPTDVLFFRDGRPMSGSLAGHSAAWPLPTVANAALHAALWRAGFAGEVHAHRRARSGKFFSNDREEHGERFGALVTAGPFPVCTSGLAHTWFFPRPLDAAAPKSTAVTLGPVPSSAVGASSTSLTLGLPYTVASSQLPSKNELDSWWSEGAWNTYLDTTHRNDLAERSTFKADSAFADTEHQIGIGIDPGRGTQDGTRIYSAHYLRLREGWNLGVFAKAEDKDYPKHRTSSGRGDLLRGLFDGGAQHIVIGGQQRVCSATLRLANNSRLPLPFGKTAGFATAMVDGQLRHLVKWVLLSPALFPEIASGTSARGTAVNPHPGGWLPNWIEPTTRRVLLRTVSADERRLRRQTNYNGYGYDSSQNATAITATLVAALVPKAIPVTGWSLGDDRFGDDTKAGAKPTHLAVPAGAVYYFACDTEYDAGALAAALNWHGADSTCTAIKNRRSTLLGEKGFGLGVCGTWQFHAAASC